MEQAIPIEEVMVGGDSGRNQQVRLRADPSNIDNGKESTMTTTMMTTAADVKEDEGEVVALLCSLLNVHQCAVSRVKVRAVRHSKIKLFLTKIL